METQQENGLKQWLQGRVVGLCMTWARLLSYHIVRSTRAVVWTPPRFVDAPGTSSLRTDDHLAKATKYPDPLHYLTYIGKYLFRNTQLRHLRIEQFNRYLVLVDNGFAGQETMEDTICEDNDPENPFKVVDKFHRNWDRAMDGTDAGTIFKATQPGVPGCRRRSDARLGVSRLAFLEPVGAGRENYYQCKLLLGLAWYCRDPAESKTIDGNEAVLYTLYWMPPKEEDVGVALCVEPLRVADVRVDFSWEERCKNLERFFCDAELGLVCQCCAGTAEWSGHCDSCRHAVGWHVCQHERNNNQTAAWKPGTLHDGDLDVERVMLNLHRRQLPDEILQEKAQQYVDEELISRKKADDILEIIRCERGQGATTNDLAGGDGDAAGASGGGGSRKLSRAEMVELLAKREAQMRDGGTDEHPTDQWRCYSYIIGKLASDDGRPLRLMIQASAGTGAPNLYIRNVWGVWIIRNGIHVLQEKASCSPACSCGP